MKVDARETQQLFGQTDRPEVTPRQIRITALRLEHGRRRKPVNRASAERATKGRKRAYADGLRDFYRGQLRGMRRQNHRAKLWRYTPSGIPNTAVTPADLASVGPSRPHPRVVS